MSVLGKDPKDWTEDDLKQLIRDRIEEYTRLEYKQEVHLSNKGKKEACKDVSAFANGQGGAIIYGMEEDERRDTASLPKAIKPITDASIKETLENVLLNGISPKCPFWMYPVRVKGGYCLVVQIPQSVSTHMVTIGRDNRFYIRRNFQSSYMTEEELGNHYARRMQAKEEAHNRYESERTDLTTKGLTIHLVTLPFIYQPRLVNLREVTSKTLEVSRNGFLKQRGISWDYELFGDEYVSRLGTTIWSRITISGTCEHIYELSDDRPTKVPSVSLVQDLHDFLLHYARIYSVLGYYGPVKLYYQLLNTKDSVLALKGELWFRDKPKAVVDEIPHDVDTYVDDLLSNPLPIVHEIMDHVWIMFGYEKGCDFFNADSTLRPAWDGR